MRFSVQTSLMYGVRRIPNEAAVNINCAEAPLLMFKGIPIRFSDMCYTMATTVKKWKRAWPRQPKIRDRCYEKPNIYAVDLEGEGKVIYCHPKLRASIQRALSYV